MNKTMKRMFLKTTVAILIGLIALSFLTTAQEIRPASRSTRVLFVGNSYTYFNNLPEIFSKLAEAGGQGRVETMMVAPGGWRLKDHWEKGEALKALHESRWDYVVLQEQSTLGVNYYLEGRVRIAGDAIFKPYAEKWSAEIVKAGAIPVFYLTWARKATPQDQLALNYAYMGAAKKSGAQVAPVGIAWVLVRQKEPSLELYDTDGSHPSPAGSYLAGCTIYATIFHRSPVGLPGRISGNPINQDTEKAEREKTALLTDVPEGQARLLQTEAWAAGQEFEKMGSSPNIPAVSTPTLAPLPSGSPLVEATLAGSWQGDLLFYPPPFLPAEMGLELRLEGGIWTGRLDLKFHSRDQKDQSLDLADLRVGHRELTFSDPKAPQNLYIRFRGVSEQAGELRGIAEATVDNPNSSIRLLGTWRVRKK